MSEIMPLNRPSAVDAYETYVQSLPAGDFSQLTSEQALGNYAQASQRWLFSPERPDDQSEVNLAPFMPGFIRPTKLDTADHLLDALAGRHVYRPYSDNVATYTQGESYKMSRRWDRAYATIIKQVHTFNLAFLEAASGEDTVPPLSTVYARTRSVIDKAIDEAGTRLIVDREKLPQFADMMVMSLMNVLFADPSDYGPAFVCNALRVFAAELPADQLQEAQEPALWGLGKNDMAKDTATLLPQSFRTTDEELHATSHPDWRDNSVIVKFFGSVYKQLPFESGCNQLFLNAPQDLIQVLLLNIADSKFVSGAQPSKALLALHTIGRLPDAMLEQVVNDQASFRTLHYDANSEPEAMDRSFGLWGRLMVEGALNDLKTLRAIALAQSIEVSRLSNKIAAGDVALAGMRAELEEYRQRAAVYALAGHYGVDFNGSDKLFRSDINSVRRREFWLGLPGRLFSGRARTRYQVMRRDLGALLQARGLNAIPTPQITVVAESDLQTVSHSEDTANGPF